MGGGGCGYGWWSVGSGRGYSCDRKQQDVANGVCVSVDAAVEIVSGTIRTAAATTHRLESTVKRVGNKYSLAILLSCNNISIMTFLGRTFLLLRMFTQQPCCFHFLKISSVFEYNGGNECLFCFLFPLFDSWMHRE